MSSVVMLDEAQREQVWRLIVEPARGGDWRPGLRETARNPTGR